VHTLQPNPKSAAIELPAQQIDNQKPGASDILDARIPTKGHNRMGDKTPTSLALPEVSYQNRRFMDSGDARSLRIISEYMEPLSRLRRAGIQHTVVFFGSARIVSR
jgi:hypothetical protein